MAEELQELHDWLLEIDLEEYEDKIRQLGVKKTKHLKDIDNEHLQAMGMLQLEIKRFRVKQNETFKTEQQQESNSKPCAKRILIDAPNPKLFAPKLTVPQSELIRQYEDLWYENPVNYKQKSSNTFILQMCGAAEHRFSGKRQLFDWARQERADRLKLMHALASKDDVADESMYFKKKSLLYCLGEIEQEYKDITMLDTNSSDLKQVKHLRLERFTEELQELNCCVQEHITTAEKKLNNIPERRKEEKLFWGKILSKAKEVAQVMNSKLTQAKNTLQCYGEEFGATKKEKSTKRSVVKQASKGEKRKKKTQTTHKRKQHRILPVAEYSIIQHLKKMPPKISARNPNWMCNCSVVCSKVNRVCAKKQIEGLL